MMQEVTIMKKINARGYTYEVQRTLYLYAISLAAEHEYHILSSFFKEEGSLEIGFNATVGEEMLKMMKEKGDELYQFNVNKFRDVITHGSGVYKDLTKEVQIKGPILPECIEYISPAAEVFLRQKDQASTSTR